MTANDHQLITLIRKGEGIDLEFKTCRSQLNRDVYQTVCAFLNRYGGDDPQMIEGDVFRIIVKVPEFGLAGEFETKGQVTRTGKHSGQNKSEVTGEVTPNGSRSGLSRAHEAHDRAHDEAHEPMSGIECKILESCAENPKSTSDLLNFLGYKSRTGNFKRTVSHLLEMGLIEMTVPTRPRSRKQKYRLTDTGRQVLIKIQGGAE
jgi:ATP-dependent DNA helicase RecG